MILYMNLLGIVKDITYQLQKIKKQQNIINNVNNKYLRI